jgi:hypothetical protein
MKTIIVLLLLSIQVFATTESVQGSGYSSGFCRGDGFGQFCLNQLQDRAKQDATRDADLQCRIRQGTLLSYSGYCSQYCNPGFLPPNQDTYVNCHANCRFDCDIRKP